MYSQRMLIMYGDSPVVTTAYYNGHRVWTTGLKTPRNVVQTYMDECIIVVDRVDDLIWDMKEIYVINEGGADVAEEAVLRGACCLNCTMEEGLWRLREIIL